MSGTQGTPANPLALSDEDFLSQPLPETGEASAQQQDGASGSENNSSENQDDKSGQQQETQENQDGTKPDGEKPAGDADGGEAKPDGEAPAKDGEAEGAGAAAPSGSGEADPAKKPAEGEKPKEGEKAPEGAKDGEAAGQDRVFQVPTSFTANGKTIQLKDEKEALALMQMGANYTRKLQEMAPHRKMLTMLQNNGVADEGKLSFFIALDKKDPEAIKKLIKDSGIDPLDLDMNIEPAYREGSYQVSDEEVAFRTHMEDLTASDTGKQTLQTIQDKWDQASKDMLWQHPEVMSIIHNQRENGVYAKIEAEVDRLRTLGQLSPTTPFLEAYKTVGDQLYAAGAFGGSEKEATQSGTGDQPGSRASAEKPALAAPAVVTTRAAAPRPDVDNGDKAGAASPSRAAPGKATEVKNFLAMSDDDFLKAGGLEGRV